MQRTCCFSSPVSQFSFWLMIVSTQTAVLPVLRSPMISWRWPRPIGRHGVDGLDAGLQRLVHALPLDHGGGLQLQDALRLGLDVAEAVDRGAQRVDHPAEEAVADRHREDAAGPLDLLALLDAARTGRG